MPIAIKITVAAVCGLLGLVGAGLVGLRDMAQRPTSCAACHSQPRRLGGFQPPGPHAQATWHPLPDLPRPDDRHARF